MGERRFEVQSFRFVLQSLSSMNHQSGVEGNHGVIARRKVRVAPGEFAMVPYVSANAMRNRMRHAAALATLDAAGLIDEPALTQRAVGLLFSGGTLDGGTGSFHSGRHIELCDLFPFLRLLGGAAGSQINPGMLRVSDLVLVCEESAGILSDESVGLDGGHVCGIDCADPCQMRGRGMASAREYVDEVQRVRSDPGKSLTGQRMMLDSEREAVISRRLLRDESAAAGDWLTADAAKSSQLPYTYETVCTGALWEWSVTADTTTDLERDTLRLVVYQTLAHLQTQGVGGKTSHGHGRLKLIRATGIPYKPLREALREDTTALDVDDWRPGRLFRAHMAERSDAVATFLRRDVTPSEVAAAAAGKPAKGKAKKGTPDEPVPVLT